MTGIAGARAWANLNNLRRGPGAGEAPEACPVRSDSPGIPSFPAQVRGRWSWQWPDGAVISCGYLVIAGPIYLTPIALWSERYAHWTTLAAQSDDT